MTVTELVQLYAPLAGLLGVVFWLGVVSERVRRQAADQRDVWAKIKEVQAEISDGDGNKSVDHDLLIRLETMTDSMANDITVLKREVATSNRLIANLAGMKGNKLIELPGDDR